MHQNEELMIFLFPFYFLFSNFSIIGKKFPKLENSLHLLALTML